jgi:hypothetical protein
MTTLQPEAFEKEIDRLNKIISAILFQVDSLKEDNKVLVNYILSGSKESEVIGKDRLSLQADPSHAENDNGISNLNPSLEEKSIGISIAETSFAENSKGIPQDIYSLVEKYKGISHVTSSYAENDKGISNDSSSLAEKVNAKTTQEYVLPQVVAFSGGNISALHLKLRSSSFRVSQRKTRETVAKLLIHFYNGNSGRYSTLKSLTGYSDGGIAKLLMILRKKGMIVSKGYQQWAPSAHALQLMKDAYLHP